MPGTASYWMPPDATLLPKIVQVVNHNESQARPGGVCCSAPVQPVYTTYMGGIGGPCQIYDPPFSYWCSASTTGGGAHIAQHNTGVRPPASAIAPRTGSGGGGCSPNAPGLCADAGLHMPYSTMDGAIVNAMHDERWANWMWEVSNYNKTDNSITFGLGGFQESRGTGSGIGGDWFVENVFEEWDSYVLTCVLVCVERVERVKRVRARLHVRKALGSLSVCERASERERGQGEDRERESEKSVCACAISCAKRHLLAEGRFVQQSLAEHDIERTNDCRLTHALLMR